MDYRRLGASGLDVSPLCLGTMMFGGDTTEHVAARIVGSARAAGVNVIDTADGYEAGRSERIVGRLIRRDRDRRVPATKCGEGAGRGALEQEFTAEDEAFVVRLVAPRTPHRPLGDTDPRFTVSGRVPRTEPNSTETE